MVIWKFIISSPENYFSISMPKGARVLSFHEQKGEFYIWALISEEPLSGTMYPVTESEQYENREFYLTTTGSFIPDDFNGRFIGTAMKDSGGHVEHLFEVPRG